MFLVITESIAEVLHGLQQLQKGTQYREGWDRSFKCQLERAVRKVKLARAQRVKSVREESC